MRAVLAELIGTFTLVFVGTATAVFAGSGILAPTIHETGEIASARRGLTGQPRGLTLQASAERDLPWLPDTFENKFRTRLERI
jgi:hypothetical protein